MTAANIRDSVITAFVILLIFTFWPVSCTWSVPSIPAASESTGGNQDVIGNRSCRLSNGDYGTAGTRNGRAFCFRGVR